MIREPETTLEDPSKKRGRRILRLFALEGTMKKILFALIIILLAVVGFCILNLKPVDADNKDDIYLDIAEGSSTAQIAQRLDNRKVIRSPFAFKLYSRLTGKSKKYKAGTYCFNQTMSAKEVSDIIVSGKIAGRTITVLPGMSMDKIARMVEENGLATYREFMQEAKDGEFDVELNKYLPDPGLTERLEGFLYPDTYTFGLDVKAYDIIDTMLKNFDKRMGEGYVKAAKKQNISPKDLITIASIVEREAKMTEEKKKVASVIYNRLEIGMPLQMDSILSYIHKEDKIKASLEDTQVDSPYNPYKNTGLPPGPICSPGKEAVEAAAEPADTEYLYFVASEKMDGSNVFSKDYKKFLKDKAKFDKAYQKFIEENPDQQ